MNRSCLATMGCGRRGNEAKAPRTERVVVLAIAPYLPVVRSSGGYQLTSSRAYTMPWSWQESRMARKGQQVHEPNLPSRAPR